MEEKTRPAPTALSRLPWETAHSWVASAAHASRAERLHGPVVGGRQLQRAGGPIGIRWRSHHTTTERATHEIRVLLHWHALPRHDVTGSRRDPPNGCGWVRSGRQDHSPHPRPYVSSRCTPATTDARCSFSCAATSSRISSCSVGAGLASVGDDPAVAAARCRATVARKRCICSGETRSPTFCVITTRGPSRWTPPDTARHRLSRLRLLYEAISHPRRSGLRWGGGGQLGPVKVVPIRPAVTAGKPPATLQLNLASKRNQAWLRDAIRNPAVHTRRFNAK